MLSYTSKITYKPSKLEQTDLVLVCDQSLSAGLCKGDYKSLYAVVMTWANLVNTQTHLSSSFWPVIVLVQFSISSVLVQLAMRPRKPCVHLWINSDCSE